MPGQHNGHTDELRKQLLAGKEITGYGSKYAADSLSKQGYNVVRERRGQPVYYRIRESIHKRVGSVSTASAADHPLAPVMPQLGTEVMVTALVLNEDGSYSIGLRNGKASWLAKVTSQT